MDEKPVYRTALITGASSGLGAEFARQLARQGSQVILIARRLERLQALAKELETKYHIYAEPLPADLCTDEGIAKVEGRIRQLSDLDLLINNAGYGLGGKFSSTPLQKQLDLIHVQINASVRLTRVALEGMLQRNRGAIINVSSMAAFIPVMGVTYSAVKAYLNNLSAALQSELWDSAIRVQALCPGFVYTEFHDTPEFQGFQRSSIPGILWLQAEEVVRASLKALPKRQVLCIPSWKYRVIAFFAQARLTESLAHAVARRLVFRQLIRG